MSAQANEIDEQRSQLFAGKTLLQNVRDIIARNNTGYKYDELVNHVPLEDELDCDEELVEVDRTVGLLLHLYGHHLEQSSRKERLRGAMDELYNADVDRLDKATFDRRMSELTAQLDTESEHDRP